MGRVKSALIKRTGEKLMAGQEFKSNFEENKPLLAGIMPSKRIRNMVAGYITKKTKLANVKQKPQEKEVFEN